MIRRSWIRPALGIVAATALTWAIVVLLVGGFTIRLGVLRVGSRDPWRALILTIALGALYFRLSRFGEWRRDLERLSALLYRSGLRHPATLVALLLAISTIVVGIRYGTFVAGSADSYGYVSEAELWERGNLHVPQPLAAQLPWRNAMDILSPLGYTPAPRGNELVPTYPPGLPLLMVLFRKVLGANGQYYVGPAMGGLLVLLTYLLGRRLTGRASIALAAALVVTSSAPFLFALMWPMTDVPVAAVWTLALLLAVGGSPRAAVACGFAASLAVLIRPNLVPVAAVFAIFFLVRGIRRHGATPKTVLPAILFSVGMIPGVVMVALVNHYLYGSALSSGYGSLRELYAWGNITPNGPRYFKWALQSGCWYVLVGIVAAIFWWPQPIHSRHPNASLRILAVGLFVAIVTSYLFYIPFTDWWYLRFMLTLWPLAAILAAALSIEILERLRLPAAAAAAAVVATGVVLFANGYHRSSRYGVFALDESRYVRVGEYLATSIAPDSVVLTMQHSGGVRYYGGRTTVRYDRLPRAGLELAVETFAKLGHPTYIVLDKWEVPEFRSHFAKESGLARLDWRPMFETERVVVYDTRPAPASH